MDSVASAFIFPLFVNRNCTNKQMRTTTSNVSCVFTAVLHSQPKWVIFYIAFFPCVCVCVSGIKKNATNALDIWHYFGHEMMVGWTPVQASVCPKVCHKTILARQNFGIDKSIVRTRKMRAILNGKSIKAGPLTHTIQDNNETDALKMWASAYWVLAFCIYHQASFCRSSSSLWFIASYRFDAFVRLRYFFLSRCLFLWFVCSCVFRHMNWALSISRGMCLWKS